MASEIRDLEDQLYQYDHEYRLLEQELESLRRRNAAIAPQPGGSQLNSLQPVPQENSAFDFLPRDQVDPAGKSSGKIEVVPTPSAEPSSSAAPAKSGSGAAGGDSTQSTPSILSPPQAPNQVPNQNSNSEGLPSPNQLPAFPPSNNSSPQPQSSNDLDFNPGDLVVPTITTGAATPPAIDPKQISVSPDRDLELSLTQVEIPSKLTNSPTNLARISSAVQVVSDKRVVELAFNPALTRAISFDDDNQDDGLYLVLLPKNELGQVVTVAAAVSIEVIDPTRDGNQAIIGKWNYSAREVEGKLQPLGSKQGIHLTLPWNGPNPKSDRLTVIATYQFENGRKLVARKEIYVNNNAGYKTVWTPRASRSESDEPGRAGFVAKASANTAANEVPSQVVQAVGIYTTPESAPAPAPTPSDLR